MKLYSTKNKAFVVDLERAIMEGLPPDNGLYMSKIKPLPHTFWEKFEENSFQENSFQIAKNLFEGSIPDEKLSEIPFKGFVSPSKLVLAVLISVVILLVKSLSIF